MTTITVTIELPEGIELDVSQYRQSSGSYPRADESGSWAFQRADLYYQPSGPDTDSIQWIGGTLPEALEELAEGSWVLLP